MKHSRCCQTRRRHLWLGHGWCRRRHHVMLGLHVQEAESQRSAPTDTASSDGGSTLDAATRGARGSRLPVDEYAAWMGTYPGMVFKLPTSRGARSP